MIANIALDDGLILPHSANPTGSNFWERHCSAPLYDAPPCWRSHCCTMRRAGAAGDALREPGRLSELFARSWDPLYLSVLVSAEKKFWRCVQSGEPPHLINVQPPRPRIEAIRIVDMSSSNSWAEFAGLFRNTRQAFLEHAMPSSLRQISETIGWSLECAHLVQRSPSSSLRVSSIPSACEESLIAWMIVSGSSRAVAGQRYRVIRPSAPHWTGATSCFRRRYA
jgi:hypothetical protein